MVDNYVKSPEKSWNMPVSLWYFLDWESGDASLVKK